MGGFFSSPSAPDPPAAPVMLPAAPTMEDESVQKAQEQTRRRLKKKQGMESTILAGSLSDTDTGIATKTLLGQ